jgi:hypothetical protein
MSRATSHPASITGHAVVRLKNGSTYVGRVSYDGRAVTGSMSLRVIVNGVVEYRPPRLRTLSQYLLREIAWDDDAVPSGVL